MPGAPSSFLLLVVRPGAPCSFLLLAHNSGKMDLVLGIELPAHMVDEPWISITPGLGVSRLFYSKNHYCTTVQTPRRADGGVQ